MISGILLAAGNSNRMGEENKLLLPYEGEPLFLKSLRAMQASDLDELIVVLGHDYKAMLPFFNSSSIKIAINGNHLEGQTSSIQAGLKLVNPSSKAYVICLADMPLITEEHINALISAFDGGHSESRIVRPIVDGKPGNPTIFSKSLYDDLIACQEKNGAKSVIEKNKECLIQHITPDLAYFVDIDTPGEYEKLTRNI
jgi:molybdenum cofactor cytidylyltransferase